MSSSGSTLDPHLLLAARGCILTVLRTSDGQVCDIVQLAVVLGHPCPVVILGAVIPVDLQG